MQEITSEINIFMISNICNWKLLFIYIRKRKVKKEI